jgi:hypothetical protein
MDKSYPCEDSGSEAVHTTGPSKPCGCTGSMVIALSLMSGGLSPEQPRSRSVCVAGVSGVRGLGTSRAIYPRPGCGAGVQVPKGGLGL